MFSTSSHRNAFTLLELLLSIAVLAALTAVALPQFAMLLGDRRLVRGADQVGIKMTELRVRAMREGRVMMMEARLEEGSLRIRPYFSMSDATEAFDQTGSQSALLNGAEQATAVAVVGDESTTESLDLPDQIVVKSVNVVSAARSFQIEEENLQQQSDGYSQPILFYPDGTTSTAAITLMHAEYGQVTVKMRGITGHVTAGLVEGAE